MADFDFQEAFTKVHERLTNIHEEVIRSKTKLEVLTGNGQPGEVHHIKSRLTVLESFKDRSLGYLAAVGAGITGLGVMAHIAVDWFKHKN